MKIITIILLTLITSTSYAKAYKCEVKGETTYQQKPCKEGETTTTLKIKVSKLKDLEKKLAKNEREFEKVKKQFDAETDTGEKIKLIEKERHLGLEQLDLIGEIAALKKKNEREIFIRQNKVAVGMTDNQVIRALGKPTSINSSTRGSKGVSEQWVYSGEGKTKYVYLENKKVTSLQW